MINNLILLGGVILAVLSVFLGFIALLKQKTYVDQKTQEPTEVEVPFFGKMKTNYPSLLFVFLGFALFFYIVYSALNMTKTWYIEGVFTSDDPNQAWTPANIILSPTRVEPEINRETGRFRVVVEIPIGKTFEEEYTFIKYIDGDLSAEIDFRKESEDYESGGREGIKVYTDNDRTYHSVKIKDPQNITHE